MTVRTRLVPAAIATVAIVGIVAAIAAAGSDRGNDGTSKVIAGTGLSVLDRAASDGGQRLPPRLAQGGVEVDSVRLARRVDRRKVYAALGKRPGEACLVVENSADASTATACAARGLLRAGAIFLATPGATSGSVDLVALVADGVAEVSGSEVVSNVAVLDGHADGSIVLRNAGGAESTVDLGPLLYP